MLGLIKADLSSAGKPHLRDRTPSLFLNVRTLNALRCEESHFYFQIVAHEIEFVSDILVRWMDCSFSWRQSEDQPAVTRIHAFETEDIAEKCTVQFGILAVDNYMSARDHLLPKKYRRLFLHSRQLHPRHPPCETRLAHLLKHLFHLRILPKQI